MSFMRKLLIGPGAGPSPAVLRGRERARDMLRRVWADPAERSVGIERLFRLFLAFVQFLLPQTFVRRAFSRLPGYGFQIVLETYLLCKILFPVVLLATGLYRADITVFFVALSGAETVLVLLSMIFLSDLSVTSGFLLTRSILILLLSYFEIVLDFSVLYLHFGIFNEPLSPFAAVYYSFVTAATLGYGDFYPVSPAGRMLVILQIITFLLFVILFVNYLFSQSSGQDTGTETIRK